MTTTTITVTSSTDLRAAGTLFPYIGKPVLITNVNDSTAYTGVLEFASLEDAASYEQSILSVYFRGVPKPVKFTFIHSEDFPADTLSVTGA